MTVDLPSDLTDRETVGSILATAVSRDRLARQFGWTVARVYLGAWIEFRDSYGKTFTVTWRAALDMEHIRQRLNRETPLNSQGDPPPAQHDLAVVTRAICEAGEVHLRCTYPDCECKVAPKQGEAVLRACGGGP